MAYFEYLPRSPLYHYCSETVFCGIVESKNLWFSDLTMSNDPRELNLGRTEMVSAFKYVRHNMNMRGNGLFLSIVFAQCDSTFRNMQPFSCCFSLLPDKLPMWREYAAGGSGLMIGFRPTALTHIPARLQKVIYADQGTQKAIQIIVKTFARPIARGAYGAGKENDQFISDCAVQMMAAITALKHATWDNEKEIRMVHMFPRDPETRAEEHHLMRDHYQAQNIPAERIGLKSRMRGKECVEYVPFPFGKYHPTKIDHTGAIESITIGPTCSMDENDVAALMNASGFSGYNILKSDCAIQ